MKKEEPVSEAATGGAGCPVDWAGRLGLAAIGGSDDSTGDWGWLIADDAVRLAAEYDAVIVLDALLGGRSHELDAETHAVGAGFLV